MNPDLLLAAAAAGSSVVTYGIGKLFEWRVAKKTDKQIAKKTAADTVKVDADAAQVIATTAVTLIQPLQAEITKLTVRVETLEVENSETKSRLQAAINYVRELLIFIHNHLPEKTPPTPPQSLGVDIERR